MSALARDHSDPGLLAFVQQLLADNSLDSDCETVARRLLEKGAKSLDAAEKALLENEIIEPYLGDCEGCGKTPDWHEVLQVYDTGLCAACFDRLAEQDVPAVRPDWMPLAPAEIDDEELPGVLDPLPATLGL